jgi:hypothetical protein
VFVINAAEEIDLANDKSKMGRQERDRINLNERLLIEGLVQKIRGDAGEPQESGTERRHVT